MRFYVNGLNNREISAGLAAAYIAGGATGADAESVSKKAAVAQRFTALLSSEIQHRYSGLNVDARVRSGLASVTPTTSIDQAATDLLARLDAAYREFSQTSTAMATTLGDHVEFCGLTGSFTYRAQGAVSVWTHANCKVFGAAGSVLWLRVKNTGSTILKLQTIEFSPAPGLVSRFTVGADSQRVMPGKSVTFPLTLGADLEVTQARAAINFDGFVLPLVVGLSPSLCGSVLLCMQEPQ